MNGKENKGVTYTCGYSGSHLGNPKLSHARMSYGFILLKV